MKRFIALALALSFLLIGAVACRRRNEDETDELGGGNLMDSMTDSDTGGMGSGDTGESDQMNQGNGGENNMPKSAADVLEGALGEFSKNLAPVFEVDASEILGFFAGGYYSDDETTLVTGGVGTVPVEETDTLMTYGLLTTETLGKVEDAALFFHAMNSNTFSASSVKVLADADPQAVADEIRVGILNNQWVCGTPEHYSLVTVGDCVVTLYGSADLVNAMENALISTYTEAEVKYSEAI